MNATTLREAQRKAKRISGFFWHVHHDMLLGWCWDEEERRTYIQLDKPAGERELRQRLFRKVRGQLPAEVEKTGAARNKARAAYIEARAAYIEARAAYNKAACIKEWTAYYDARAAYDKTGAACDRALMDNMPAIEALHKQECLDCSWDGKTIFGWQDDIQREESNG